LLLLFTIFFSCFVYRESAPSASPGGSFAPLQVNTALVNRPFSEFIADGAYLRTLFLYIIFAAACVVVIRLACKTRTMLRRLNIQKTIFRLYSTMERESDA
jgi:hypothetical protein